MSVTVCADGSAEADSHDIVEVDRSNREEAWRYRCPNGHTRWQPRRGSVICHSCAKLHGVDPTYVELWDEKAQETIPWSAIELV